MKSTSTFCSIIAITLFGFPNLQSVSANADNDLLAAASTGDLAGVNAALKSGANINAIDREMTPLGFGANQGHTAVVRLLLQKGADPNLKYPIMNASAQGHLAIVKILIAHGADFKAIDDNGQTALFWSQDQPEVHAYLKEISEVHFKAFVSDCQSEIVQRKKKEDAWLVAADQLHLSKCKFVITESGAMMERPIKGTCPKTEKKFSAIFCLKK